MSTYGRTRDVSAEVACILHRLQPLLHKDTTRSQSQFETRRTCLRKSSDKNRTKQ